MFTMHIATFCEQSLSAFKPSQVMFEGTWNLDLGVGAWNLDLGSGNLELGTCILGRGTWILELET